MEGSPPLCSGQCCVHCTLQAVGPKPSAASSVNVSFRQALPTHCSQTVFCSQTFESCSQVTGDSGVYSFLFLSQVQQSSFYGYTGMLPKRYAQGVMTGESEYLQTLGRGRWAAWAGSPFLGNLPVQGSGNMGLGTVTIISSCLDGGGGTPRWEGHGCDVRTSLRAYGPL